MSDRIPDDHAEIVVPYRLTGYGPTMITALGVELAAALDQSSADDLIDIMIDNLENVAGDQYTLGPGWVNEGMGAGTIRWDGSTGPQTGGLASASVPPNVSVLVKKNTGLGTRRGRGRMFLPAAPEGEVENTGQLTSGYRAAVQSVCDDIVSTLEGHANVNFVVLFHDTAPFTPTAITGLTAAPVVATQRRRLIR